MMLINKSGLTDADEKKLFNRIGTVIEEKGKIVNKNEMGKQLLAYPIKKEKEGNYWLFSIQADPQLIAKINGKLKMEENILRFLILRKQELKKKETKAKDIKGETRSTDKKVKKKGS